MFSEYLSILLYIAFSTALSAIILGASYVIATQPVDTEKLTAYECGFEPFDDARTKFEVRFYLVAILFIIFDLEISFLFPWAMCIKYFTFTSYAYKSMFLFLAILTVGFVYEWKKGALEWE